MMESFTSARAISSNAPSWVNFSTSIVNFGIIMASKMRKTIISNRQVHRVPIACDVEVAYQHFLAVGSDPIEPRDILTRSDTWINKDDLVNSLQSLPDAVSDSVLREKLKKLLSDMLTL